MGGLGRIESELLQRPLPSLDTILQPLRQEGSAALELGCGEGAAITRVQLKYPLSRCTGTNSIAWTRRNLRNTGGVARQRTTDGLVIKNTSEFNTYSRYEPMSIADPDSLNDALRMMATHYDLFSGIQSPVDSTRMPSIHYLEFEKGLPYANGS